MPFRASAVRDVLIVGAGGHGLVVLDILRAALAAGGCDRPVGFLDANPSLVGQTPGGLPVLGPLNTLPRLRQQLGIAHAIVAIGDNRVRRTYAEKLVGADFELIRAIHPSAIVSSTAKVGPNAVIAAGAIISTGVHIADSVIINTGALLDHESRLDTAVHIAPGARLAGRVTVGENAFVGLGAVIIQCLNIGAGAVVNPGAVVLNDVPPGQTVAGNPAGPIRRAPAAA